MCMEQTGNMFSWKHKQKLNCQNSDRNLKRHISSGCLSYTDFGKRQLCCKTATASLTREEWSRRQVSHRSAFSNVCLVAYQVSLHFVLSDSENGNEGWEELYTCSEPREELFKRSHVCLCLLSLPLFHPLSPLHLVDASFYPSSLLLLSSVKGKWCKVYKDVRLKEEQVRTG